MSKKRDRTRRNMNHEPLTHLRIRRATPAYDACSIRFVRPLPSLREHVRNNFEKPPRSRCRVYKKGVRDRQPHRVVKKSPVLEVSRDIRLNITRSRLFSPGRSFVREGRNVFNLAFVLHSERVNDDSIKVRYH